MGDQELRSTEQWYKVHPPVPEVHWGGATRGMLEWQQRIGEDRYADQQAEDAYQALVGRDQSTHKDAGKPAVELLSPLGLLEVAKVLEYGKGKYGPHNWRQGILWDRIIASILRHTLAYLGGETLDRETGLSHMAHAACDALFLVEYESSHPELDNRYDVVKGRMNNE